MSSDRKLKEEQEDSSSVGSSRCSSVYSKREGDVRLQRYPETEQRRRPLRASSDEGLRGGEGGWSPTSPFPALVLCVENGHRRDL